MKQEDFSKFKEGVQGVYSFYAKEVSDFALDVWWNALRAYDLPAVIDSFNRHLMNPDTGQWLPKPADIVKMFGGRTQDRALQAWSKVDRAVRVVGPYESVVFDDPLVHRVLHEMGGWIGLSQKTEDEWPFVAKEFENRYRAYSMRSESPDYPPVLIGIAEAHNDGKGLKPDAPRLIGNAERAELVMRGGSNVNLIGTARAGDSLRRLTAVKSEAA
jgi:hypothetical protein